MKKTTKQPTNSRALIGRWFHSYETTGDVKRQGHILAMPASGMYLVQYYEWGWGEPTTQAMVNLSDMTGWTFYDSNEDMLHYWKTYLEPRQSWKKETSATV